jgi:hypothetical protein
MNLCVGRLGMEGALAKVVNVFAPMAAATAIFVLLAWLFRVEELGSAWGLVGRRFTRKRLGGS